MPKEFEALLILATPCEQKEVSDMISMFQKMKHTEDIVMVIRRLAFERDKLKDELRELQK